MPDILLATVDVLKADAGVSAVVDTDVYDSEIPQDLDATMSMPLCVVRLAGGASRFAQGTLELKDPRIEILCYAKTAHLASVTDSAVFTALRAFGPATVGDAYVHWYKPTAYGVLQRNSNLQWPYVVSVWTVLASSLTIGA